MNENTRILSSILNIYQEAESYNKIEALEIINQFALDCNKNRNGLLYYLKCELEDTRLNVNLCPKCGKPLSTQSYEEGRDECTETMYYNICSDSDGCG